MRIRLRFHALLAIIFLLVSSISFSSTAQQATPIREKSKDDKRKSQKTKFIQLRSDKGKPKALQTSISRYVDTKGKSKATVDLVGVVHIGDKAYYQEINKRLKDYDVVLYELVAPEGTKIDKQSLEQSQNPLRFLQSMPQKMMDLESQLEHIDYEAKNFVHADLTPKEIAAKMAERGDSTLTLALDAFSEIIRQQNRELAKGEQGQGETDLAGMFDLMGDPAKMKMMMAKQFVQSDAMDLGMGKSINQILIQDRNEEAIKELGRQLFAGHKKIAIFYGAAHMPDFESRLKKQYGLELKNQSWLDAWDLTKKPAASADDPSKLLLELLKELGG